MRKCRKWLKSKKAFTLLECVLAVALLAIVGSSILPLLSAGASYVGRSRVLDELSAQATDAILTYDKNVEVKPMTADDTLGYSKNLPVTVTFSIQWTDGKNHQYVPYRKQNMVAVIAVNREQELKVVYFDVDPALNDKLYKE